MYFFYLKNLQVAFTKTFVQHYAFIMKTLKKSHESDTMSNRIVHISVQLFSNEELARQVTEECQLLDIMVTVLLYMMESCLIKSELQGKLRIIFTSFIISILCVPSLTKIPYMFKNSFKNICQFTL